MSVRFASVAALLSGPLSGLLYGSIASAQVKPYIIFDFDTSGSMLQDSCGNGSPDATVECPGSDVSCATCNVQGCGNGIADDSKLWKVKKATTEVVSAYGEVTFGLARFHQTPAAFACKGGGWLGAAAICGGADMGVGDNAADILVDFADGNQRNILEWLDGTDNYPGTCPTTCPPATGCTLCPDCGGGCDKELRGTGGTPDAGSLFSVNAHIQSTKAADPEGSCRPYGVILLTDGADNCIGDPEDEAAVLCGNGVPVYSIGFGTCPLGCDDPCFNDCPGSTCPTSVTLPPDGCFTELTQPAACISDCTPGCQLFCQTNEIADLGCGPTCDTSSTGQTLCTGQPIVVDNENDLSLAMSDIIQSTILVELCNGLDDDCDGLTDEGFPVGEPCGLGICAGTLVCTADGTGTVCNGPPPAPAEVCNGLDDDCDGLTDEGFGQFCGCVPQAEVCNGLDDDCDGLTDEEFTPTPCGSDVGECSPGMTQCSGGTVTCVGEVPPSPEVCDCLDNNCDSVTDEMTTTCYDFPVGCDLLTGLCEGTCQIGTHTCTAATCPLFDACVGERGPEPEVCDNVDNDCDGITDDDDMGGTVCCGVGIERCNGVDDDCDNLTDESFPEDGLPCGSTTGECQPGTWACVNGMLDCQGEVGGTPEVCNGLDDDCDGSVDEDVPGVGAPCGDDTGQCEPGIQACVNGHYICVGAIGPTPEACDCQDNDCDGLMDSDPAEYPTIDCPGNGVCNLAFCQCVLPCGEGEFPCPGGYVPVRDDPNPGDCFCEPDVCVGVVCDPGSVCEERDGQGVCVSLCENVQCDAHEVCENGSCVDNSCQTMGCPQGQQCIDYHCVDNPCAGVTCQAGRFCDDGECCPSRCDPACAERELCHVADCQARCQPDPCFGVGCPEFQICQDGRCVPDPCVAVTCAPGEICCNGDCIGDPCLTFACAENEECVPAEACQERELCRPLGITVGHVEHVEAIGAGGCKCALGSGPQRMPAGAALLGLMALALTRRRRGP
jgi:MYXO-CTERM domain-containing protein